MVAQPSEIRDFIAVHHPFALLPDEDLDRIARQITLRTLKGGDVLMQPGEKVVALSVVRSGALETRSPDGALLARLGEGDAAGVRSLLGGGRAVNRITAMEDTLLYQVPDAEFHRLRDAHASFNYFFAPLGGDRLRGAQAAAGGNDQMGLTSRRVGDLIRREPVSIGAYASIRETAACMSKHGVSCVLVVEEGRLVGIVTDRDLRNRVLAVGRSADDAVVTIMTPEPKRIEATAFLFEALLMLSRHNIHHLPVLRDGVPLGLVTSTDLLRTQVRSVVFLAGDVLQRDDAEGIREALTGVPDMVSELVQGGASAYSIGHAVSSLTDAATERLIQLAERTLGKAPVPYVWLAVGSQGRNEQTARSDQDNCLVLDDRYDPAQHGDYFAAFSKFVCDGLDTAGYVHCPGEIMAMTPRWRQSLANWKRTFTRWIDEPEPAALMYSSVFFDFRPVCGDEELFQELQAHVLKKARGSRLFLGHLVGNALTHRPPLGIFRNIVLISGGDHHKTLDLKLSGVVPIIDLARIYALDAGVATVNTHDRLKAACEAGKISRDGAHDLIDALEFLGMVRLRHQARQVKLGRRPDNYLPPDELSPFERGHLKDAFSVVQSMQGAAVTAYRGGRG